MKSGTKEWGNLSESLEFLKEMDLPLNSKILDIGCYTGSLIADLCELGFSDARGVDTNKHGIQRGWKLYPELRGQIVSYDGKNLPFPEASFDVITMFDVLEHIVDLEDFLERQVREVVQTELPKSNINNNISLSDSWMWQSFMEWQTWGVV